MCEVKFIPPDGVSLHKKKAHLFQAILGPCSCFGQFWDLGALIELCEAAASFPHSIQWPPQSGLFMGRGIDIVLSGLSTKRNFSTKKGNICWIIKTPLCKRWEIKFHYIKSSLQKMQTFLRKGAFFCNTETSPQKGATLFCNIESLPLSQVCGLSIICHQGSWWEIYDKHLEHLCHDSPPSSS